MNVSIIIVNWNSRDFLKTCIASIVAHTRDLRYEIIVIDAASFDGCDQMLREEYPEVRFLQATSNLGFAGSNNRAFREARGECVLFLNPDTEVLGSAVNVLHARLTSLPNAGMVGGKLLNSDGTVQTSCIQTIPTILNQLLDSECLRRKWPRSSLWGVAALHEPATGAGAYEVEAISGACLMVKRNTFLQVGGFSEDYFMYVEDMDLSDKVRKAGFSNYYVPAATVIHHGGNSSQQAASAFAAVMMPEAIWRFLRKTRGSLYGSGYRLAMCASALGRLFVLGLAVPFRTSGRRSALTDASRCKWLAVLRWSLNLDGLVKQYYPAHVPRRSVPIAAEYEKQGNNEPRQEPYIQTHRRPEGEQRTKEQWRQEA